MKTLALSNPLNGGEIDRAERGVDVSLIAQLAFARAGSRPAAAQGRHLALLPTETLELDLSDPAQREFGDYELLELIGEGGMGVVYRARQASLDREVAIKLLAAGVWASSEFVERFRREAQNAARMQHPNIVSVYEVGSHDEMHFFSMRLVCGPSLAAVLKRDGRLAPRRAAEILRTVAEAVDYAHRLGVMHLDLKPANVLIDENGTPFVADFGLARRLDSALAADSDEVSGTPSYMAPEQASPRTARITPATDVWGLGAILYELITGEPPFLARSPQETLKLVVQGSVRNPRRHVADLPRDLEAIILKCLAYGCADRYASARDLADDLRGFLDGRAVSARPLLLPQRIARWAQREPKLATAAVCAVSAMVIGLFATTVQWRRADTNASAARDNLWAARAQTAQQALAAGDGFHSLRPLIANLSEMEATGRNDAAMIERDRIGAILANAPRLLDFLSLPAGESATSLAIAPDARHFAVATHERKPDESNWRVHQFEMASLRETWSTVTNNRTFMAGHKGYTMSQDGLRYSADGKFLLLSMQMTPILPAPRRSDMIAFDAHDGSILWPSDLPVEWADIIYGDAARIAMVRYRSEASLRWPDCGQFYSVANWLPIGPRHCVATTLAADFWLPAPDGKAWLGTRDSTRVALYDVPSLHPRWQLQLPQYSLVRAWAFSHDGHRIALGSVDGAVRLVDAGNGRSMALTTAPEERVKTLQFSADDRTLAALDKNGQIWAWDATAGAARSTPVNLLRTGVEVARIQDDGETLFGAARSDRDSEIGYVTLAPHAPFGNRAVPGAVRISGIAPDNVFDISVASQRMLTASITNLIEVWKLPAPSLLVAHAAPLLPDMQRFNGTRIVGVDGKRVRIVDVATSTPLSPSLVFPQPVRFAEFSPDGQVLAVIAGRTLRIIEPDTGRLRATIVLSQTPQRASIARDAPILVLTTSEYAGDVQRERIQRIDLAHGTLIDHDTIVNALDLYRIDAQGRHALIQTWNTVTHEIAGPFFVSLDSGKTTCQPALDGVHAFAIAPDAASAWFDLAANGTSTLQRWDLASCRAIATYDRHQHESVIPTLLARADGSVVVHRSGDPALLVVDAYGHRSAALGEAIPGAMHDFALSADGARAAFATRNAIHVIDARQGRSLTAPLSAAIAGDDAIAKLTFSPDGTRLLARTINGRWILRELPRSELDTQNLERLARVLDPQPGDAPSAADLAALRSRLTQAHPAIASPKLPTASHATPIVFEDPANAQLDARFVPLDLRAVVNQPLIGSVWSEPHARGDRPTLAPGLQRFLGIDYRIDGGMQLVAGGTATAIGPELHRSAVVGVPDIVARRVHVLALMHIPLDRGMPPRDFAYVVLIGADRRETRLAIRTVHDVVTDLSPALAAPGARIAFFGVSGALAREGDDIQPVSAVYSVTLDVPPTVGPIHALRFDVADGPMEAPLLYAATLERATDHGHQH